MTQEKIPFDPATEKELHQEYTLPDYVNDKVIQAISGGEKFIRGVMVGVGGWNIFKDQESGEEKKKPYIEVQLEGHDRIFEYRMPQSVQDMMYDRFKTSDRTMMIGSVLEFEINDKSSFKWVDMKLIEKPKGAKK